jgi:hypothetical protein
MLVFMIEISIKMDMNKIDLNQIRPFIYAKNWLSFYESLKWFSNMAKVTTAIS